MSRQSPADVYETYIRTADGQTYYAEDAKEGIKQFLSDDGYRISFNIEGVVITLRKGVEVDTDMTWLDEMLTGQVSVNCAVTIRKHDE